MIHTRGTPANGMALFKLPSLLRSKAALLLILLTVTLIYYVGGQIGIALALPIPPGNVTAVWLGSPVAWAAVLLFGNKVLPAIWLGDVLVNTPAYVDTSQDIGRSLMVAGVSSIGSTLEAFVGAFLFQRLIGRRSLLNCARNVFKFVAIATLCPTISATIGIICLCIGGISSWENYGALWYTWWVGNTVSLLVVTPMLLTWLPFPRLQVRSRSVVEVSLLLLLLAGVGYTAFGLGYPVEYMLIPCLVWAAFRFEQTGATAIVVLAASMALLGTAKGIGPFVRTSLNESLLLLQTFMSVVAITTLFLVAILRERKQAELALRQSEIEKIELISSLQNQTTTLDQALQNLQKTQAQLVQTEKMSSLGQLVAGVAHEINNPVNFIYGNLGHVQEYTQDLLHMIQLYEKHYPQPVAEIQAEAEEIDLEFLQSDLRKILGSIRSGTDRIREIVKSLRTFSRTDESALKEVNIHEGIDSTLLILQHRLKPRPDRAEIEVVKNYGSLPQVECFAGQLNQVFMNILANSIDALEDIENSREETQRDQSRITIRTFMIDDQWVEITIADNGYGIPAAIQQRIFEPFFTTKPIGKGTGIGMSISYQIVTEQHGGRLQCVSTPGVGTEFVIQIPIRRQQYAAA